jgi:hypothetical protein
MIHFERFPGDIPKNYSIRVLARVFHDITFYFFSIIAFALFLQWVFTFQILSDPVRALRNSKTDYFSEVLGVCTLIFSIVVTVDLISYVYNTKYDSLDISTLLLLYALGLGVIICYFLLYAKFIRLMHSYPDLRRQVHPFFVFMIVILSIKFILNGFWEFDLRINTVQADLAVFYTNIGIEILFNILLIYYQVTCNKRQAVIDSQKKPTPS